MTTETRNEAAELDILVEVYVKSASRPHMKQAVAAALAAERRATVERLTDAVEAFRAENPDVISREAFQKVVLLLDAEAAR